MAELLYDDDADLTIIQGRKVAVIGYGEQGQAHSLNLRDSGVDVRVGLREGSASIEKAQEEGLRVVPVAQAAQEADVIVLMVPDHEQQALFLQEIAPHLQAGNALGFAHGFAIRYGYIQAPADVDVFLVSAKGSGDLVRREYEDGRGVPVLLAVEQDATGQAWELVASYAMAMGGLRAGGMKTTFAEEAETHLFAAQAVRGGGLSHLVKAGFETLVEAGYQPQMAYLECLHELKTVVDVMVEQGLAAQRRSVSDTSEYGDYVSGPRVVDANTKSLMKDVLEDVRSGAFAERFIQDQQAGAGELTELRAAAESHEVETMGTQMRPMFPWIAARDEYSD
ncbi:Ketol-acid reductoisomerase [Dermatophilus congolensis]|uniref:Ketol-acid reductoisomerase (NADP(+)) n=1 Tax=Dermatophilus congolensis TaxID=1863 RepID=A0A239VDW6_9MICO|nr:ketol-acid reductoisomerase [Dermatophilus congolensis]SNV20451.1 Ketol-acid reductoisomerase [Dermatophilus congolensis]